MRLILTVIGPNKKKYDFQVDSRQHIATTLRVLDENLAELAGRKESIREMSLPSAP